MFFSIDHASQYTRIGSAPGQVPMPANARQPRPGSPPTGGRPRHPHSKNRVHEWSLAARPTTLIGSLIAMAGARFNDWAEIWVRWSPRRGQSDAGGLGVRHSTAQEAVCDHLDTKSALPEFFCLITRPLVSATAHCVLFLPCAGCPSVLDHAPRLTRTGSNEYARLTGVVLLLGSMG